MQYKTRTVKAVITRDNCGIGVDLWPECCAEKLRNNGSRWETNNGRRDSAAYFCRRGFEKAMGTIIPNNSKATLVITVSPKRGNNGKRFVLAREAHANGYILLFDGHSKITKRNGMWKGDIKSGFGPKAFLQVLGIAPGIGRTITVSVKITNVKMA